MLSPRRGEREERQSSCRVDCIKSANISRLHFAPHTPSITTRSMDPTLAATLHAYARDGLPQHVQAVCSSAMQRRGGASAGLQFWRAYGLLAAGATAEVG